MTDQMVMKVYYLYQNLPKKTLREHFLTLWRKLYISQVKYMEHVGLIRNLGVWGNSFKPLWNLHDTGRMIESNRCTAAEIAVNLCDL